jgi:two-component sensor histidine kinase
MNDAALARIIADGVGDPMLVLGPDRTVEYANAFALERLGATIAGCSIHALVTEPEDQLRTFLRRCSGSRNWLPGRFAFRHADGTVRPLRVAGAAMPSATDPGLSQRLMLRLSEGSEPRFVALSAQIQSLTDEIGKRRRAEAVLEESLRERDLLIRELHHRVKNNMSTLIGLLSLTLREATQPETQRIVRQTLDKLQAITAVQQILYRSADFSSVLAADLLIALCAPLQRAHGAEAEIVCRAARILLSNELAMPLALIVNELVTNAVKHGKGRNVRVNLDEIDGALQLTVEDEGPGFEPRESASRVSGLGLVRGLVRQLGGRFNVEKGDKGARCVVRLRQGSASGLRKMQ